MLRQHPVTTVLAGVTAGFISWKIYQVLKKYGQDEEAKGAVSIFSEKSSLPHCRQFSKGLKTPEDPAIEGRLTVVVTTSPVQSNPSTVMIEDLLSRFALVPGLESCRKIIVCDGYREAPKNKYRSGQITVDSARDYQEYIGRVEALTMKGVGGFVNCDVISLKKRGGFGLAVKAALSVVKTKYILVVQHDRSFIKGFDLCGVLDLMDVTPEIKYVGLHTSSTIDYAEKIWSKYKIRLEPRTIGQHKLLPMVRWYDSTHICSSEYYRNFVFGPRRLTKGNFIEADLGQAQIEDIRRGGMAAHEQYGTFLLDSSERLVAHIDGRSFRPGNWKTKIGL